MYGFTITNMSQAINWSEEVEEYHKHYDDEDGIYEYIESLLPQYYGDIYQTYHDVIGTPLNITIENEHVGLQIWQVMTSQIFSHYYECFMDALEDIAEVVILSIQARKRTSAFAALNTTR